MNKDTKIIWKAIDELIPYEHNAKEHPDWQIEQIKQSIIDYGMNDPISITPDNIIIEGHGRYYACKELGINKIPALILDNLNKEQIKAYMLVHNKLTMNTGWDYSTLLLETENIDNPDFYNIDTEDFEIDELTDIFDDNTEISEKSKKTVVCPCCHKVVEYE